MVNFLKITSQWFSQSGLRALHCDITMYKQLKHHNLLQYILHVTEFSKLRCHATKAKKQLLWHWCCNIPVFQSHDPCPAYPQNFHNSDCIYIYIYNTVNKDYLCEIYLNYTLCINNQSGKVLFPYHNDYEFFSCQISVLLWKGFQLLFQWFLKSLPSYNIYIYSIHFSLQWEKTALHQYHLMNEMIFWTKRFALFMNIP